MTPAETAALLAKVQAFDKRTVGRADVAAWHEVLATTELADALEAVTRHYRESADFLMPAHVRQLVKVIRSERREHHEALALPGKLEDDPARAIRMQRGTAQVREVLARIEAQLAAKRTPAAVLTPSDEIRQRALERATAERRGRRY